ncbi:FkbM family methyltransferase [Bernardetia sp.]|uniref:FkbM family methyltransferase n=1 Tax=Bernardetia sp. TaxID=1937974 RepID=UPI0025BB0C76|nr:FkbM family methyltransferase [Bernardetia sp.]
MRKIFDKIFNKKQDPIAEKYQTISVDTDKVRDTKFNVYNNIERVRTEQFGNEREALDFFINTIEDGDIVLDVGASVGLFSVVSAKYPNTQIVYSFEPDAETYNRLNENIQLNELSNVKSFQKALSDKKGVTKLYTDGTNGFAPTLVFQKNREGAPSQVIEIQTEALDNFIQDSVIEVPDNIKVDIEGAEILFLKGARKTLAGSFGKKPRSIFLEIHPEFLPDFDSSDDEVRSILLENGYELIWESGRETQIHTHWIAKD